METHSSKTGHECKKKEQVGKTIQLSSRNRDRGQTEMKRLGQRLREYRLRYQQRCRHQHSVQHNHQMRDPTARGSRDSNRAKEELAPRNCFNELGEVTSSDETVLSLSLLLCLYSLSLEAIYYE